jgi:erythromycin esterase
MLLRQHLQLTILFTFLFLGSKAQEVNSVIQRLIDTQLIQVNSINPNDTLFTDLKPIKEAIGNAKIIMLGEQDHGDAATFLAKTRLIKYLHIECGFDVLAFESDFYSLNMLTRKSEVKINDVKDICNNRNVYPIWTNCEQNEELFKFLNNCLKTTDSLIITGFDSRHTGGYAKENYVRQFDSMMKAYNLPFQQSTFHYEFIQILTDVINKEYNSKIASIKQQKFLQYLDTVIAEKKHASAEEEDFWNQELKNLKAFVQNSWLSGDLFNGYSSNIRDEQMGNNLLWLLNNQFADKKIIVWAHNFHISKNINQTEANKRKEIMTMGGEVNKVLKDEVYILGFDSYKGTAGPIGTKPYKIGKSSTNSLEHYIYQKNYDFAFINFKNLKDTTINRNTNFKMKAYFHREINGEWLNVFDGIFYIESMYPCIKCDFH